MYININFQKSSWTFGLPLIVSFFVGRTRSIHPQGSDGESATIHQEGH